MKTINPETITSIALSTHRPDSPRHAHVAAAIAVAQAVESSDASLSPMLVVAASFHDIGLAPGMAMTGFHAVDGADIARKHGLPENVADSILHHTGSFLEMQITRPDLAGNYGLIDRMMKTKMNRALTFCDLRSGSAGGVVTLIERLADIRKRRWDNPSILKVIADYEARFQEIDDEFGCIIRECHAIDEACADRNHRVLPPSRL
jgi:hypothetical protein